MSNKILLFSVWGLSVASLIYCATMISNSIQEVSVSKSVVMDQMVINLYAGAPGNPVPRMEFKHSPILMSGCSAVVAHMPWEHGVAGFEPATQINLSWPY